jgi:hypothetical protein
MSVLSKLGQYGKSHTLNYSHIIRIPTEDIPFAVKSPLILTLLSMLSSNDLDKCILGAKVLAAHGYFSTSIHIQH